MGKESEAGRSPARFRSAPDAARAPRGAGPGNVDTLRDDAAEAEAFKAAMRMLPVGVVVVTSEIDARPWGLTVSACCSISPYPPKLLISLGRHTRTREAILETGSFGVDVLRASQRVLAELCAAPGLEKWIDEFCVRRVEAPFAPAIANSLCHFDCLIDTVTEVNDHSLVIGRVAGTLAATDADEPGADPLLYFDRAFHSLGRTLERTGPSWRRDSTSRPRSAPRGERRPAPRRVAIVGAGQAGLQLAFGLLEHGWEVTVYSDKTPAELLEGRVPPTAAMFDRALSYERELGLNRWDDEAEWFDEVRFDYCHRPGEPPVTVRGTLERPGHALDQRLKFSTWMQELESRGGMLRFHAASVHDLEELADSGDLVVVATGRGEITALFDVDEARSVHDRPQRLLCLLLLHDAAADQADARRPFKFTFVAGQGEILWIPFLDKDGNRCRSVLFEARPGAGFDRFRTAGDGREALEIAKDVLHEYCPWERSTLAGSHLPQPRAWARGGVGPTVRRPVGHLASGRAVMPAGDTAILNDPLASQGANTAAKMAHFLTERTVEHGARPFGPDWMEATLDDFWELEGRYATGLTEALLEPEDFPTREILLAGSRHRALADQFVAGLNDPRTLGSALTSGAEARRFISTHSSRPWLLTAAAARLELAGNRWRRRFPSFRGDGAR